MSQRKCVFIIGPNTSGSLMESLASARQAMEDFAALVGMGYAPYSRWLQVLPGIAVDFEEEVLDEVSDAWLARADAAFLSVLPGEEADEESSLEAQVVAELGVPVFTDFRSLDEAMGAEDDEEI